MEYRKIMLVGPSGVGKTTLAQKISEDLDIPFISGSYSDLITSTKSVKHEDMLKLPTTQIQEMDYQVLNLRHKAFAGDKNFISDRSYMDSMAYFIHKLSSNIGACETDDFLGLCETLLFKECTHLIILPFSINVMGQWGKIEDNNKRITNPWFQFQITKIIDGLLEYLHFEVSQHWDNPKCRLKKGNIYPSITHVNPYTNKPLFENEPTIKVLYLDHKDLQSRIRSVHNFLNIL